MKICEQCGIRNLSGLCRAEVFGKIFYFCGNVCRDFWLAGRSRRFGPPEKPDYANPLNR